MYYAVEDKQISRWIRATMPGYVLGGFIWAVLSIVTGDLRTKDESLLWAVPLVSIGCAGFVTGITQGICLHSLDARISAKSWAGVTVIGMVAGLLIVGAIGYGPYAINFAMSGATFVVQHTNSVPPDGPTIGLAITFLYFGSIFAFTCAAADGLVVGIMQWIVIRPYVREAYWWALINMLATGFAGVVVLVISCGVGLAANGLEAIQESAIKSLAIGLTVWSAMGFTIGAISAPLLNWLLRQPIEEGRLL